MTGKIELFKEGNFGADIEMFVSLLLTRVREKGDIEAMVVGMICKDNETEVAVSSMEIRDLAYVSRTLQMYTDDRIRENVV